MKTRTLATLHDDAVLSCTVHPTRHVLLSGGEDARLCFTDLIGEKTIGCFTNASAEPVTSVCCHPREEHSVYAAVGTSILNMDLRKGYTESAVTETFQINEEEINSIVVDASGCWLGAADDSGQVQLISIFPPGTPRGSNGPPTYKTLRRGHRNICSSVVFQPHRQGEVISGGLDCQMIRWNFLKLRPVMTLDMNNADDSSGTGGGSNQFCNPPMVHAMAVPEPSNADAPHCSLVAVARGDCRVALYDICPPRLKQSERDTETSCSDQRKAGYIKNQAGTSGGTRLSWMSPLQDGHTAAVNTTAFVPGSAGKLILSGGNDAKLCLWDWQHGGGAPKAELQHREKINWVCTDVGASGTDAAFFADVRGQIFAVSFAL